MTLRDILGFKDLTLEELLTIAATGLILLVAVLPEKEVPIVVTDIFSSEQFDEYPLIAWKDVDKKGDIVKIKYRVRNTETYIKVYDVTGYVVHTQPFHRSPWDDGRSRDFTYTWMLYYTQDYGDEIPPGDYEIRVCHTYDSNVDLSTTITI
jgi:hypothetical protein